MAKRIISESFTFNPSTRTITILNKAIKRNQLLLILNVRTNTVIYNFSDSSLAASSYTLTSSPNAETTTIVLNFDTGPSGAAMSSTDPLSIIVDEPNENFFPAEPYRDPVEKLRVSPPQSLIDTDFEYGNQSTKWETIALTNNRPAAFYDPTQGISNELRTVTLPNQSPLSYQITNITGTGTNRIVTVTINNTTGITTNTPIYIQDATDQTACGWYLPNNINPNVSFTYIARANVTSGPIFDPTKTYLFVGSFYTGSVIPHEANAFSNSGETITVTTRVAHGLSPGQAIYIVGVTGTNPPNGAHFVQTTPTAQTFTYSTSGSTGTPSGMNAILNGSVFPRTWGSSIHRAFDGGVSFTAGYPYHGNQLIRQTRRYFRYQSGKGIQFSTGSNLCSPWQVESLTAVNAGDITTVTVTVKYVHNVGVGAFIKVSGADQGYNGTFRVASIPSDTTFTYVISPAISLVTPATSILSGGSIIVQPFTWFGAQIRIGMFDSQNGMFFEYDGQTLHAVRRSCINQIPGFVSTITQGSQTVTGINSTWSKSLTPGDFISLRGSTYKILSIESDTSMTIYPDYRGTSLTGTNRAVITKVIETRIPQSQWNLDKLDGTGPSSMLLDITKMQMWFIDYSWYGAGTIRYGIRDNKGQVIYCHKIVHGNSQIEAYMRTGNLPARYEVNTLYPITTITSTLAFDATTLIVSSTTGFPDSGTLLIKAPTLAGAIEAVTYSGKTSTSFTGLTRNVVNLTGPGGLTGMGGRSSAAAAAFTYSATAPVAVEYWGPQCADTISHWGSSVIMDGRFDDDKSFLFNYGINTLYTAPTAGTRFPVFSIRLAPSVDNGLTGILGQREVINRMQLQPFSMDVFSTGNPVRVELLLNARVSGGVSFAPIGGSSLVQKADHLASHTISGGESILTFFVPTGGVQSFDLLKVRDIGNSILGGGNSLLYPTSDLNKYPDGPDILTVAVVPIGGQASILARLNWLEAQA
jgi:hypothetical protein